MQFNLAHGTKNEKYKKKELKNKRQCPRSMKAVQMKPEDYRTRRKRISETHEFLSLEWKAEVVIEVIEGEHMRSWAIERKTKWTESEQDEVNETKNSTDKVMHIQKSGW